MCLHSLPAMPLGQDGFRSYQALCLPIAAHGKWGQL